MKRCEAINILEYNKLWNVSDKLKEAYDIAIDSMKNIDSHNKKLLAFDEAEIRKIKKSINIYFDCDVDSKFRANINCKGRFALGYYLRFHAEYTYQDIGRFMGKTHANIIHYCNRHDYLLFNDDEYKASFEAFLKDIKKQKT